MNHQGEWYNLSYEAIYHMADWEQFSADIPEKFTCIFAWMPMQLLNVKHAKGKVKGNVFSHEEVRTTLQQAEPDFEAIRGQQLLDADLQEPEFIRHLECCCQPLAQYLGWVAASKYLHFSASQLFIMWDNRIRGRTYSANAEGYHKFLIHAQEEMRDPERYQRALACVSGDPGKIVRGLDILHMQER